MADDIKTVVTKREDSVPASVMANTPESTPSDVQVIAMHPVKLVAIRAGRTFLVVLASQLAASGLGADASALPDTWAALTIGAMRISAWAAGFSMLLNSSELLARLDQSHPQLRA